MSTITKDIVIAVYAHNECYGYGELRPLKINRMWQTVSVCMIYIAIIRERNSHLLIFTLFCKDYRLPHVYVLPCLFFFYFDVADEEKG